VPSLWRLEAEVVLGVVSFGFFAYGIGADPNPISYTLLMPVVIVAALGNLRMTAVTWVVSLGVVVGLLAATGAGAGLVVRMGLFYGMASGVIALIIQVVVSAAFTALSEHRQVAEVAEVAARADDLATGLDQILPLMCAHVGGPAATAHRVAVPGGAVESLAACPRGADPGIDDDRLAEAARSAGISLDGHRAFLVVPESGGSVVLVAMDLGPAARHGRWGDLFKVELRLLLVQLENLVKRTHSLEQLHRMTRTDALTGLPNRRALFEELGARFQADTAGVRPRPGMVAAMLDLDDFKDYNDTFGHLGGDQALRMFARSIHEAKRTSDFVARFGGEEFCVLLADADERRALRWLERCRHAVAASPPDGGPLTFSAGVATWDGRESADELLRRADAALYDAKAAGKDRSIVAMGSGRAGPHTPPRGTTLRTPP
jgi:diguanylate cyclase (GGDEF)-like protein